MPDNEGVWAPTGPWADKIARERAEYQAKQAAKGVEVVHTVTNGTPSGEAWVRPPSPYNEKIAQQRADYQTKQLFKPAPDPIVKVDGQSDVPAASGLRNAYQPGVKGGPVSPWITRQRDVQAGPVDPGPDLSIIGRTATSISAQLGVHPQVAAQITGKLFAPVLAHPVMQHITARVQQHVNQMAAAGSAPAVQLQAEGILARPPPTPQPVTPQMVHQVNTARVLMGSTVMQGDKPVPAESTTAMQGDKPVPNTTGVSD